MSKQSYGSSRRPGSLRRKSPTDLVAVFGCEEVTKSLLRFPGASVEMKCRFLASATDDLFTRTLKEAVPGQLPPRFIDELRFILDEGKLPNRTREKLAWHHLQPLLARYRASILTNKGEELAGIGPAAVCARDGELSHAEEQLLAHHIVHVLRMIGVANRTLQVPLLVPLSRFVLRRVRSVAADAVLAFT
jgi:hypothetical protein